ncbi:ABC transporter [Microbacterium sp. EYE_5]|uniref:ABC transporter n=1 Tax=unclassified Microbacterium TaxID=2609290 RepID=UPI002004C7AB|nr:MULTISPECIES: ABC transporter [unclassified Microbacterium]MCK6079123.1 ABC transporter [Microbacterium sp. EYE_382]MCK6084393.1 ABC transporter [Microbacterium sp. EYE_384]MCK6123378.1 ABC transporter [Microbacterium sp. EYE_80]MCK6125157.1 ABC transporter [Microbacterium sp. EYE_79]MCK6140077.1 ABC transporter [Microbacterium sp. EYE_39]
MSDPTSGERDRDGREPAYGEPVEDTTSHEQRPAVDEVVGNANSSLAEAEAASRTSDDRPRGDSSFSFADRGSDLSVDYGKYSDPDAPVTASAVSEEPLYRPSVDETEAGRARTDEADADAPRAATADETPTTAHTAAAPAVATEAYSHADQTPSTVTASEPAAHEQHRPVSQPAASESGSSEASAPTAVYSQQPIFVQAPEAPRPRGNRGAAGAIGLLAALLFAVLYLAAGVGIAALNGEVTVADLGQRVLDTVTTWGFWVPVVVFFLGFWLLGAFINRGRWGLWVILGLLVGAVSYGGHLLGQLFEAPFWSIAPSQAGQLVGEQLLAPLAVIAFILGREITIWFGAWVAARGRRVTELNAEAQREYERTLEAGPQLHQY